MEESIDFIKLLKECPGLVVSIRMEDLVRANNQLIAEARRELEKEVAESNAVTFLTRDQVMAKLNVVPSTLWRWKQRGYLVPVNVGGQFRYRSSDIDKMLEA